MSNTISSAYLWLNDLFPGQPTLVDVVGEVGEIGYKLEREVNGKLYEHTCPFRERIPIVGYSESGLLVPFMGDNILVPYNAFRAINTKDRRFEYDD